MATFFQAVESIAIVAAQTDAAETPSLVVNTAGFTVTGCSPNRTRICYGGLTCKLRETAVHLSFNLMLYKDLKHFCLTSSALQVMP